MLSRDVLNEEEREEEAEGMLRFDDNKLPSRALLVFSPDPELGLIRRKLEDVEEGLAPPPDSSSLLLAEPPSPDLRKDPEPPPGRHDIVWCFLTSTGALRSRRSSLYFAVFTLEKVKFVIIIPFYDNYNCSLARWKQLLAD